MSLKDMREQMRGAAYTALKDVDSRKPFPSLEDGLSDGSGLVRALAAEAFESSMPGDGRHGAECPGRPGRSGEGHGAEGIGESHDRSVIPLLEKGAEGRTAGRAAGCCRCALSCRSIRHVGCRSKAASAPNPEERASALRMVGELKDARGLPILLEAITNTQPSVRGAAASALGDLGKVQGIPALEQALEDKIPAVKTSAAIVWAGGREGFSGCVEEGLG